MKERAKEKQKKYNHGYYLKNVKGNRKRTALITIQGMEDAWAEIKKCAKSENMHVGQYLIQLWRSAR